MNDDIDMAKSAEQFVPVMQSVSEHWQQCVRNVAEQNGIDTYTAMYLVSTISVGAVFGLNFPDNIEILHNIVNSKIQPTTHSMNR